MARIARKSVGDGTIGSESGVEPAVGGTPGDPFGAIDGDFGGSSGNDSGDGGNGGTGSADAGTGKRPRKPRSPNGTRKGSKGSHSVKAIEDSLKGIHGILAVTLRCPELVLEDDESKPLAESLVELLSHYDIPALDPKYLAALGFVFQAGKVYIPKAILIKARLDEEARAKKAKNVTPGQPANIAVFDPPM